DLRDRRPRRHAGPSRCFPLQQGAQRLRQDDAVRLAREQPEPGPRSLVQMKGDSVNTRRPRFVLDIGLAFLLALAACAWRPAHAADPREAGPLALLISYHTAPANRVAFRQAMEQSEVPQLERWRAEGVLKTVHVVFNRHVDSPNWD